ncbi:MAG: hypothetical protein ACREE9_18020 [Stellaceae bacterium]
MNKQALIVSHADGDGHLIAEQTRRNLSLLKRFNVAVVVDQERTKDHHSWTKLESLPEIDGADYIFFMDIMFAPASFDVEATYLVNYVNKRPEKHFFLIDHHPLPLRRLEAARNLRVMYRPDVSECTLGPRSGMMVIAALCERQVKEVADIKRPTHDVLALGMRRASAPGGLLPGDKLLALLRADRWGALLDLGKDDPGYHRLPRGRRSEKQPRSATMATVEHEAVSLLAHPELSEATAHHGSTAMSYDLEIGDQRLINEAGRRQIETKPNRASDLEAIVTLLEVAALSLTTTPGAGFTIQQLIEEAIEIGGDDVSVRDMRIVLKKANFLEKLPGGQLRLK